MPSSNADPSIEIAELFAGMDSPDEMGATQSMFAARAFLQAHRLNFTSLINKAEEYKLFIPKRLASAICLADSPNELEAMNSFRLARRLMEKDGLSFKQLIEALDHKGPDSDVLEAYQTANDGLAEQNAQLHRDRDLLEKRIEMMLVPPVWKRAGGFLENLIRSIAAPAPKAVRVLVKACVMYIKSPFVYVRRAASPGYRWYQRTGFAVAAACNLYLSSSLISHLVNDVSQEHRRSAATRIISLKNVAAVVCKPSKGRRDYSGDFYNSLEKDCNQKANEFIDGYKDALQDSSASWIPFVDNDNNDAENNSKKIEAAIRNYGKAIDDLRFDTHEADSLAFTIAASTLKKRPADYSSFAVSVGGRKLAMIEVDGGDGEATTFRYDYTTEQTTVYPGRTLQMNNSDSAATTADCRSTKEGNKERNMAVCAWYDDIRQNLQTAPQSEVDAMIKQGARTIFPGASPNKDQASSSDDEPSISSVDIDRSGFLDPFGVVRRFKQMKSAPHP